MVSNKIGGMRIGMARTRCVKEGSWSVRYNDQAENDGRGWFCGKAMPLLFVPDTKLVGEAETVFRIGMSH